MQLTAMRAASLVPIFEAQDSFFLDELGRRLPEESRFNNAAADELISREQFDELLTDRVRKRIISAASETGFMTLLRKYPGVTADRRIGEEIACTPIEFHSILIISLSLFMIV